MTLPPRWERFISKWIGHPNWRRDMERELARVLAEHDAATTCRRCGKRCADDGVPECSSCLEAGDGPVEQPAPTCCNCDLDRSLLGGIEAHETTCPLANAQAAPDGGRLSELLQPFVDGRLPLVSLDLVSLQEKLAALEAKLAAAERERDEALGMRDAAIRDANRCSEQARKAQRELDAEMNRASFWAERTREQIDRFDEYKGEMDEAVAKERARCLAWVSMCYGGPWNTALDAIRDGKPSPKV